MKNDRPTRILSRVLGIVILVCSTITPSHAQRVKKCMATGQDSQIVECSSVIAENKSSCSELAIAYNNRGIAFFKKGNLQNAAADFNSAIELNERFAGAYLNRAELKSSQAQIKAQGDESKGAELLAIARQLYEKAYDDYWRRQYDVAIAGYSEAIQIDPAFTYAYYGRGDAYRYKEEWRLAAKDYSRAIELMPPNDPWFESAQKSLKFAKIYSRNLGKENESDSVEVCNQRIVVNAVVEATPEQKQPQTEKLNVSTLVQPRNRLALVVGIDTYVNLEPLEKAIGDAEAVAAALESF